MKKKGGTINLENAWTFFSGRIGCCQYDFTVRIYIYMYMYMFQYFLENLAVHFNVFYQPGFPSRIVPNPNLQSKNM